MTVGRSGEAMLGVADEGARDDAADAVLAAQDLAGDAAVFIELLQGNDILVRRDLEHGVGRGVDDQVASFHMLRAVFLDDLGARPRCISQHAASRGLAEGLQNLLGEAVRVGRQGIFRDQAGDLPMADGGILARRGLVQTGNRAALRLRLGQIVHAVDVAEAVGDQVGNMELFRCGAAFQRVDTVISELCGVGRFAAAAGIQNDQKDTFHIHSPLL